MQGKHLGRQSVRFPFPPSIISYASVVGKKEGEGPLSAYFDQISTDTKFGQPTWEKAESQMQTLALQEALKKGSIASSEVDMLFAGDLLNQCIGTSFAARGTDIPFYGLYGACSTMAESLSLASMAVEGGFANLAAAVTSSHFASAERQYRLPLEYGGQRTPTAQWTVTGSGAVILGPNSAPPYIRGITTGKIVDLCISDANNMGAAMAPAFVDTVIGHFKDTGLGPSDYDLIVSGDLGQVGLELAQDLFRREGYSLGDKLQDCGTMIFDLEGQDVHAGGSGCGCSAVVLCGYLMNKLQTRKYRNLLFCGTGALLSPVSTQQGESIPAICHAVAISMESGCM
jgi:stage V sporulation protein AD